MDFSLGPIEEKIRKDVKEFVREELPSPWEGSIGSGDDDWTFSLKIRKKLVGKGWLTMSWPEEYGGMGASIIAQTVFNEEMAYHRIPGRDGFGLKMLAPTLMIHGTDNQKAKYLPPLARGEGQWCQGYSEPESGSDLASLQCNAVEDGDNFIINGTKVWTTNAHRADHIFFLARTDPDAPKHKGISFFLTEMKKPGITVDPIYSMDGSHHINMINFDNVKVPRTNLVGEKNRGWYVAATLLDFERSGIEHIAGAKRLLEEIISFALNNSRNGVLLANDPLIRKRLSEMAISVETGRLLSYRIAWMQEQELVPNKEASMGKLFGTELLQKVAALGLEILGMFGQLEPDSKYVPLKGRIEKAAMFFVSVTLAGGTSEIQRNIIATRGLGLPRL